MAVLHLLGARKGEVWAQRLTCTCRGRRVGGDAPRVLGKDESIPRLGRSSCGPGRAWSWGPRLSDKEMSRASKCYSGFKKTKKKQLSVVSPQRDFHPQMCICVFALFLVVRGVCVGSRSFSWCYSYLKNPARQFVIIMPCGVITGTSGGFGSTRSREREDA